METPVINFNAIAYESLPDNEEGDKKGIVMFINAEKFKKDANSNAAKWMHRMACRYNDPANPAIAAARFRAHAEDLAKFACSHQVPESVRQDPKKMDIKGNGAFAQAVKKLLTAMELGADLLSDDCSTVSKCVKWSKERKDEIEKAERERLIHEYLKEQGIDPNSPEGLRLLGGDGAAATDPLSEGLRKAEEVLRKLAEVGPEGQAGDMLESFIKRVEESTAKIVASINEAAAKKAAGGDYC